MKNHTNPTQLRHRHRSCVGFIVTSFQHYTIRKLKGKENNYTNYTQIATQTLHLSDFPCVTKCIVCAENYTQTIHKPDIERQRVKERTRQRVKETKRQGDKESKSQREDERKSQREGETKRLRVKETEEAS